MNAYHVCSYAKHKQKGVTKIGLDSNQIPFKGWQSEKQEAFQHLYTYMVTYAYFITVLKSSTNGRVYP